MKGIAHFLTGVAIATCFPEVVQQAAGGGLLPVLGGVAGILPDTLDFKFVRYFERYDLEIDPGQSGDLLVRGAEQPRTPPLGVQPADEGDHRHYQQAQEEEHGEQGAAQDG